MISLAVCGPMRGNVWASGQSAHTSPHKRYPCTDVLARDDPWPAEYLRGLNFFHETSQLFLEPRAHCEAEESPPLALACPANALARAAAALGRGSSGALIGCDWIEEGSKEGIATILHHLEKLKSERAKGRRTREARGKWVAEPRFQADGGTHLGMQRIGVLEQEQGRVVLHQTGIVRYAELRRGVAAALQLRNGEDFRLFVAIQGARISARGGSSAEGTEGS